MTESTGVLTGLSPVAGKLVHAAFDGGRLTSDAGVLLLAEIDRRLGVCERLADCIEETRAPERIQHTLAEMIRFRALLIAAGYADANNCDALRSDPAFRWRSAGCRRAGVTSARSRPSAGWRTCPVQWRSSA
ncbi:hypothetical protein J2849_000957 [Azospirillum melinis]|nr:hypothetical protein [Azospirillum melinis]